MIVFVAYACVIHIFAMTILQSIYTYIYVGLYLRSLYSLHRPVICTELFNATYSYTYSSVQAYYIL